MLEAKIQEKLRNAGVGNSTYMFYGGAIGASLWAAATNVATTTGIGAFLGMIVGEIYSERLVRKVIREHPRAKKEINLYLFINEF